MNINHDPKTGKFTKKYKPTKVDNVKKILGVIFISIGDIFITFVILAIINLLYFYFFISIYE